MRWAVLDTNIYIGYWERGMYEAVLSGLRKAFIIRHSAVVLSELRRGARKRDAQKMVAALWRLAPDPWEPTSSDWWEAGRLVREFGDRRDWGIGKRRDFQNDALIALTARRHGATFVTSNRTEFELLARELGIQLLLV